MVCRGKEGIESGLVAHLSGLNSIHVGGNLRSLGAVLHFDEVRNGDRGEDADDGHNNHELDEGESLLEHVVLQF